MSIKRRLFLLLLVAGCRFEAGDPFAVVAPFTPVVPPPLVTAPSPPAKTPVVASAAPAASSAAAAGAPAPGGCRSALPFKKAPAPTEDAEPGADAKAPALATTEAIVKTCGAIAQRSRKSAAGGLKHLGAAERAQVFEPLLRCFKAGKNAWTFEVTSAPVTSMANRGVAGDEDAVRVTFHVRPVFVREDGSSMAGRTLKLLSGDARFAEFSQLGTPRFFDWDSDGQEEIYFVESHGQEENNAEASRASRFWVFSAHKGAVRERFPEARDAGSIRDVDGDGRPDLVMESRWVLESPCGGIGAAYLDGPRHLLHARPDGTFSSDDEVARGFIADQCRAPIELYLEEDRTRDELTPAFLIGCLRWWGKKPEELRKKIAAIHPDADGEMHCYPKKELDRLARIEPPTSFRLTCP